MTTNEIQVFSNSQFGDIRTIIAEDGEPRFCLIDLCEPLGLNPAKVSQRLEDDLLSRYPIQDSLGREQQANFVNEAGLYDAIFQSRKKEAKLFRKWVTSEVLPSIRKTGGYIVTKAEDTPEEIMARALVVAQSTLEKQQKRLAEQGVTIERQEQQIQEQHKELEAAAPKVSYYDDTLMSINTLTMTQAANSIGLSVHELISRLQKAQITFRQSGQLMLRVPYCQWGLHKTRTNTFTRSDGSIGTSIYMVWTQKGLRFINALHSHNFNVAETMAEIRKAQKAQAAAQAADVVPVASDT